MLLNPLKELAAAAEEFHIVITNANPNPKTQFSIRHLFCIQGIKGTCCLRLQKFHLGMHIRLFYRRITLISVGSGEYPATAVQVHFKEDGIHHSHCSD
jgi:hypothetical protein